jgi:hypothetical protein
VEKKKVEVAFEVAYAYICAKGSSEGAAPHTHRGVCVYSKGEARTGSSLASLAAGRRFVVGVPSQKRDNVLDDVGVEFHDLDPRE